MAISKFVLALGLGLVGTVAAQAADLQVADAPAAEATVSTTGAYIGVQGGLDTDEYYNIGVVGGLTFTQSENFLLGVEGAIAAYNDGTDSGVEGYVAARAGLDLHPITIYGLAGAGAVDGEWALAGGLGAEFDVTDSMSLRAQAVSFGETTDSDAFTQFTLGAIWHL
jgi:opacity protein-like surface antigen